jgi:hypothetical protein
LKLIFPDFLVEESIVHFLVLNSVDFLSYSSFNYAPFSENKTKFSPDLALLISYHPAPLHRQTWHRYFHLKETSNLAFPE